MIKAMIDSGHIKVPADDPTIPKLVYFGLAGRAEPIRMALGLKNVDFIDQRLSFEEFGQKKAAGELPLGSVPIWLEQGITLC